MYDTLLFLHVLAAFALVATVVIFSAFALGASPDARVLTVGNALWTIGGLGTIIFGVWLALYVQGYEIWDGWIITAIVLWAVGTELGRRAQVGYRLDGRWRGRLRRAPRPDRPPRCTGCARSWSWRCSW